MKSHNNNLEFCIYFSLSTKNIKLRIQDFSLYRQQNIYTHEYFKISVHECVYLHVGEQTHHMHCEFVMKFTKEKKTRVPLVTYPLAIRKGSSHVMFNYNICVYIDI